MARVTPEIPIAARRAGATGILDLTHPGIGELRRDQMSAVRRLQQQPSGGWGIRTNEPYRASSVLALLAGSEIPEQSVPTLVVSPADDLVDDLPRDHSGDHPVGDGWPAVIDAWRAAGGRILVEVTGLDDLRRAELLEADALVAVGAEAGGWTGDENSFVLLQHLARLTPLPVIARGGIGLHSAAAAYVLGAAGVVLDAQLLLTREAPTPAALRRRFEQSDGSETINLHQGRRHIRLFPPAGPPGQQFVDAALLSEAGPDVGLDVGLDVGSPVMAGQDIGLAAGLAGRFPTVGRLVQGIRDAVGDQVATAARAGTLVEQTALARLHGTRYPIVQGPMTRVSDTPEFARAVADAGALPYLALALSPAPVVDELLARTAAELGDRPWGVGILGFVPDRLRAAQLEVIIRHRPPYALIAGGHPDQARQLESAGIPTYLHVPSPGLLRLFLAAGARRFVFEGSECGGHVGPRSSFVLWDTMISELLQAGSELDLSDVRVLFAGGITDGISAAAVAALAAPLVEAGAAIGVLMGTAYLATTEIVATGAVTHDFQHEALDCLGTALLESGRGYLTRCAVTPIVDAFHAEAERLRADDRGPGEVLDALEQFNLGRLRIASKGLKHGADGPEPVPPAVQRAEGLYMMGQAAALRDATTTCAQLHQDVSAGAEASLRAARRRLDRDQHQDQETGPQDQRERHDQQAARHGADGYAIIGMSCVLPGAPDLDHYWANILAGVDAVTEVPRDRWDPDRYFDADPTAPDHTYSRWGGFLSDVIFDPLDFGMPPNSLPYIESMQLLALHAVREAVADAGYAGGGLPRETTSVIFGAGGGVSELGQRYAVRSALPGLLGGVPDELASRLPEWTEDSFPGVLVNVTAGRIANRFDFGGINLTVDAACASSLAALEIGCRELDVGTSDVVVVGGVDTMQNSFGYLAFAKTHALSPSGRCRPFDKNADGIAISEGVAVVIMKRLADAERDGDRIYAVLRGMGGSSDGRALGLTAPRPEGQARALRRAYAAAGFSPGSVGLVEAHGTGTVAGDRAEVQTLRSVFEAAGAPQRRCAIGSVKSMIGHTKCAAGLAGLIKISKALHHRTLPPTIGVEEPNPDAGFPSSPFYVNTRARPWYRSTTPRRAAVSAFGFGGTNFHAVLQEYDPDPVRDAGVLPAEVFLWSGDAAEVSAAVDHLLHQLERRENHPSAVPRLSTLAAATRAQARDRAAAGRGGRLAVIVADLDELTTRLRQVRPMIATGPVNLPGAWWCPALDAGPIAFLYPGQGSQRAGMFGELAIHAEPVRAALERASDILDGILPKRLVEVVQPVDTFTEQERRTAEAELRATRFAQPALGAAAVGLTRLLADHGIRPRAAAGHSYGEYPALWAAGVFDEDSLYRISELRGRCIAELGGGGSMLAVPAAAEQVRELLDAGPDRLDEVWLSNRNSPRQTVLSGTVAGLEEAERRLAGAGIDCRKLNVAAAFHSPLVAPAAEAFSAALAEVNLADVGVADTLAPGGTAPDGSMITVYANATASSYAGTDVRAMLSEHLLRPVRFAEEIEAMYADGSRVFVEVGPGSVLTGLVDQILGDREHLAVAVDGGVRGFLGALGRLWCHGVPVHWQSFDRDTEPPGSVDDVLAAVPRPSQTSWLVNGAGARPLHTSASPVEPVPYVAEQHLATPEPTVDRASSSARISQPPNLGSQLVSSLPAVDRSADLDRRELLTVGPDGDGASQVVQDFQRVMDRFLTTSRDVMMQYLSRPSTVSDEDHAAVMNHEHDVDHRSDVGVPDAVDDHAVDPGPILPRLRRLLAERTGYPEELLNDDLDLEGDLGIDSIKRTEVVGALLRDLGGSDATTAGSVRSVRTLSELAEALERVTLHQSAGQQPDPQQPDPQQPDPQQPEPQQPDPQQPEPQQLPAVQTAALQTSGDRAPAADLPRLVAEATQLRPAVAELRPAGSVLIIDRGSTLAAAAVARGFADRDTATQIISVTDPAILRTACASARDRLGGPPAGLLFLADLDAEADVEDDAETAVVQSLAAAAGSLAPSMADLAFVLAAVPDGTPVAAAVAGFLVTLSAECPGVRVCTVHLGPTIGTEQLSDLLYAECGDPATAAEIRYPDRAGGPATNGRTGDHRPRRTTTQFRQVPQARNGHSLIRDSVVLLTGGARGITARLAEGLGRRGTAQLVLAGRTALASDPVVEQVAADLGTVTGDTLRAGLARRLATTGELPTAAQLERRAVRWERRREVLDNLDRLTAAGIPAEYVELDVTDGQAVAAVIDGICQRHGRLDIVVHGAGVLADHLIAELTPEQIDRVLRTKITGARNLAAAIRKDSLRRLLMITSVAGWFGNPGQAAYAAANRVLDGLAVQWDAAWPCRVTSISFGPWDGSGMATEEIRRQFQQRGIEVIDPEAGVAAFLEEVDQTTPSSHVLIGRGPWLESADHPTDREAMTAAGSRS
ncbi:type I polyketide synthase [Microlunatus sp. Gsoil 973]|uniref:type I polyketide synthase n=1 Tax=Microlunatus sp. Gsoil 973 TaxID=2672569 RepID=UPI0018A81918|nr:type I polyketide synthase [Microlunatus sp. Gsoil 973]